MMARMQTIGGVLLAAAAGICVLPAGNAQQIAPGAVPARRVGASSAAGAAPSAGVTNVLAATPSYPSGLEYAPQFATPQMQQLHAEEIEAANEAKRLIGVLSKGSESEQAEAKTRLREALVRQFDAQQKRRTQEIASLEERLGKLKETLQKRDAAKDAIVGKRFDQLTGAKDDLAWEETRSAPPAASYNRFPSPNKNWSVAPYAPSLEPSAESYDAPPALNLQTVPGAPTPVAPVPAVPSVPPLAPPALPSPAPVPSPAPPPAKTAAPAPAAPAPPLATPPFGS